MTRIRQGRAVANTGKPATPNAALQRPATCHSVARAAAESKLLGLPRYAPIKSVVAGNGTRRNGLLTPGTWLITLAALLIVATFFPCLAGSAATSPEVEVPSFGDKYSRLVRGLESGQTGIDYREFRESFLESRQFEVAASHQEEMDRLKASLGPLIERSKHADVIRVTKAILSIDYTDLLAHKLLRQAYKLSGDAANEKKYHDIEFGLLNSIVKNGDGKSCATAWPVIQVKEEYFILQMLGATLKKQAIDRRGGICDRMEVTVDGRDATYYFGVAKVFESYKKSE
jgi:hypothetical protein